MVECQAEPNVEMPQFFSLPYDIRRLIYEHLVSDRAYAAVKAIDANGNVSTFLCSSAVLSEEACLFLPAMPSFRPLDMRFLRTSKAFFAEAGAVARELWTKTHRDFAHPGELNEIVDLIRTRPVLSFGHLSIVRLLKETNLTFSMEQLAESGAQVEIVPSKQYTQERMVLTGNPLLSFKTTAPIKEWARESIDELDYVFYQGVLRMVQSAQAVERCEIVPLEYFGSKGTEGKWLVQDVWEASDLECVINERKLRALIEFEGED